MGNQNRSKWLGVEEILLTFSVLRKWRQQEQNLRCRGRGGYEPGMLWIECARVAEGLPEPLACKLVRSRHPAQKATAFAQQASREFLSSRTRSTCSRPGCRPVRSTMRRVSVIGGHVASTAQQEVELLGLLRNFVKAVWSAVSVH